MPAVRAGMYCAKLWALRLALAGAGHPLAADEPLRDCAGEIGDSPNLLQMGLNLQSLAETDEEDRTFRRGALPCPLIYPRCHGLPQICDNAGPNAFRVGLASKAGGLGDPANVMLDLTRSLGEAEKVQVLVMAMFKQGAYTDDQGFFAERATPLEDSSSTLLELRLSLDGKSVEIYKPVMSLRTSDPQTAYSFRASVGKGLQISLPRFYCKGSEEGEDRIIVDIRALIERGFFVVETDMLGSEANMVSVKEFPTNLDLTADYGPQLPLLRVGYTMVLLPAKPMLARGNDDRLLYFDTQFHDKGNHAKQAAEKISEATDSKVSMIWRYDLARLQTIRFYVDPSVPLRWRPYFKKGIEAWNSAFTLVERPQGIRGLLPGDKDWPPDYDLSDARFSAISWDMGEETVSMGIAKVDPRSGEIMKCDVVMSDSWVKNYLDELELELVNFTNFFSKSEPLSMLMDAEHLQPGKTAPGRILQLLRQSSDRRKSRSFGFATAYMRKRMRSRELEAVIGAALQEVVMHEVGHCLGLRHNFKGSLGVSQACLKDKACTGKYGTSASVMDYIPLNLPRPGDAPTHVSSPTIGAYDKLAIRYGYTHLHDPAGSHLRDPTASPILEDILKEAENFQTCYDDDRILGEDPSCLDYDLTSDPVGYWESQLGLYADVQRHLLDMSVAPRESYDLYGRAVQSIVGGFLPEMGVNAVYYLGGINNTYLHKYTDQARRSRQPVPADTQRRALSLILKLLRPQNEGLLPPDQNLPFLVKGDHLAGAIQSLDLPQLVRDLRRLLLEETLRAERLLQVHKQENLLGTGEVEAFAVSEFLSTLVYGVMSAGLDVITSEDERDLQRVFVQILASKLPVDVDFLPAEVTTQLQYFRSFVYEMAEGALDRLPTVAPGAEWRTCAAFNQTCTCTGLVRLRETANKTSSGLWSGISKKCLPVDFSLNASTVESGLVSCECLSLTETDVDQREAQRLHVESLKSMLLASKTSPRSPKGV